MLVAQTLEGPFPVASKLIFASNSSFGSIFQDTQDSHSFAPCICTVPNPTFAVFFFVAFRKNFSKINAGFFKNAAEISMTSVFLHSQNFAVIAGNPRYLPVVSVA